MRNVYIYAAACYCEECARKLMRRLDPEKAHLGSDAYPVGPYSEGGGDADSPQHCDSCGVFLENPLTRDGVEYVREAIANIDARRGPNDVTAEWAAFYADELAQAHVEAA